MLSEIIYMFKLKNAGKVVGCVVGTIVLVLLLCFIYFIVDRSVIDSIIDTISIILGWVLSVGSIIGCFCVIVSTVMTLVYNKDDTQSWKDLYRKEEVEDYLNYVTDYQLLRKLISIDDEYFNEKLVKNILFSYVFHDSIAKTLEENNIDENHAHSVRTMIEAFRRETGFSAIYV